MMRKTVFTLGVAAALALAGCSGTTASNTDDVNSQPTTSLALAPNDSGKPSEKASKSAPAPDPNGEDLGAREVDKVPPQQGAKTPEEHAYIDAVADKGVDVAPAEDQLIAAAQAVCQAPAEDGPNVTALAIGGQLVEQGLTKLSAQEATDLIEKTARDKYCAR